MRTFCSTENENRSSKLLAFVCVRFGQG